MANESVHLPATHAIHRGSIDAMQGNCSMEPYAYGLSLSNEAPLADRSPGQCVLVTNSHVLHVQQKLWIDNIYIRQGQTRGVELYSLVMCQSVDCNLWLTSVTMQGSGELQPFASGITMHAGKVYGEGESQSRAHKKVHR